MKLKESDTVEFKQIVVDDVKKELLAFANSRGGTLYVGITDGGDAVGVDNPDNVLLQISNMVRDGIKPDMSMFVDERIENIDGKLIAAVYVQRGTGRPYYLTGKGMRPEGVYVRQGAASVPASDAAIRKMISETDGDSYEGMRSINQELTFIHALKEFELRGAALGLPQMRTLGMLNADGIYTNLGRLLSDQCAHTIKSAVFQDGTQKIFTDRREFTGSLLAQLGSAYEFMDQRNSIHSKIDGLMRIDTRDYPGEALREALINAVVHREYALGGSTLIKIFSDRIEIISAGGLAKGMELEDILSGYSICRNASLANAFYRLTLIEAYGTGFGKIFGAYIGSGRTPEIKVTSNTFSIMLPNVNTFGLADAKLSQEEMVFRLVREKGEICRSDVESLLSVSQTSAGQLLKKLSDKGILTRVGSGRNTRYRISRK
jgi:ATP-dependent DNA helicase RecG